MDKDINRIKVVLAEKGGAARQLSVLWRAPEDQQMAGRTTGLCSNNSIKMVYQRLSANDCQPTIDTYLKIAELLDVELTELVRTKRTQLKHPSF